MVWVFIPSLKFTPSAESPDHQSHAALPGLIQEVSAMAQGGLRLRTMLDSMKRPGLSATIMTRQGECTGVTPTTETPGISRRGESRALMMRSLPSPSTDCKYIPE